MDLKRINQNVTVAGQIQPEDVATLKDLGFTTIINNRPEGESGDQPAGEDIEAAAKAAGLNYVAIPLGREGVSPPMVEQTRAALEASAGPVFAFCRSGTRSTTLWALSQAGAMEGDEIIRQAGDAGYDVSHLSAHLARS